MTNPKCAGAGGELAAVARICKRLPRPPSGQLDLVDQAGIGGSSSGSAGWVQRWAGDDAAAVDPGSGPLLLTVDTAVAGVHGDLDLIGMADFGWRAVAGAISDVAAMGGHVRHLLIAVAGPPTTDLDQLYDGILAAAEAHGAVVVGGDLSSSSQLVVSVTVTGQMGPAGRQGRWMAPVTRDGARPGHVLAVTGALGASAAGLRLLRAGRHSRRQEPRLLGSAADGSREGGSTDGGSRDEDEDAAMAVHRRPVARLRHGAVAASVVSAMMDMSDGLGIDLARLAEASGVGFRLSTVPVAPAATRQEALGGGEDYELLMATADVAGLQRAFRQAGLPEPIPIGVCTGDPTERLLQGEPMAKTGWEHPWG